MKFKINQANSSFANFWVHNGFLTVDGEKMSKSLKNFITVRELLDKGVKGEVIRYLLLNTHYRKPLDWTDKGVSDAAEAINTAGRDCATASRPKPAVRSRQPATMSGL